MKLRVLPLLACAALGSSACRTTTSPPVLPALKVDPTTPAECGRHCESIGMKLSAVVIIMSSTGCVCEPTPAPGAEAPRPGGAGVTGGAAVHAMLAAAEEDERRRRSMNDDEDRRRRETSSSSPWSSPGGSWHH